MGTTPQYDPAAHDLPDTGKLSTWRKVLLGVVTVVGLAVAVAPFASAFATGCLATLPVCAAEIAEMATGGASGGSSTAGGAGASFTWASSKVRYSETATAIGDDANTIQNFMRSMGAKGHDVIVHGDEMGNFRVDGYITHPEQIAQLVREPAGDRVTGHAGCSPTAATTTTNTVGFSGPAASRRPGQTAAVPSQPAASTCLGRP